MAAVEHPDRNQIQKIQPGAGIGESGPDGVLSLVPQECAGHRGQKTRQRSSEAYVRLSLERNSYSLPAHVGAKTREKNGHVGGQSAPLDVDIVTHLVDQNEHGKTKAEL